MRHALPLLIVFLLAAPTLHAEDVKVTVIAILASERETGIDAKIADIAAEIRKKHPRWKGFQLERTTSMPLKIGEKTEFPLVEKVVLEVTVHDKADKDGRYRTTIKPPLLGEITYSCRSGKIFPIITPYETNENEVLIVGVMSHPYRK